MSANGQLRRSFPNVKFMKSRRHGSMLHPPMKIIASFGNSKGLIVPKKMMCKIPPPRFEKNIVLQEAVDLICLLTYFEYDISTSCLAASV